MSDARAERARVINEAWRQVDLGGCRVMDKNWRSGEHQLDLVATDGHGTLIAVDVRDPAPGGQVPELDDISDDRADQLRAAAQAWAAQQRHPYDEVRVDVVGFVPSRAGSLTCEHVEGVA